MQACSYIAIYRRSGTVNKSSPMHKKRPRQGIGDTKDQGGI